MSSQHIPAHTDAGSVCVLLWLMTAATEQLSASCHMTSDDCLSLSLSHPHLIFFVSPVIIKLLGQWKTTPKHNKIQHEVTDLLSLSSPQWWIRVSVWQSTTGGSKRTEVTFGSSPAPPSPSTPRTPTRRTSSGSTTSSGQRSMRIECHDDDISIIHGTEYTVCRI